ncbi:MAG TPA: cell division protein FtsK, partial [Legionellales bacterium]|nr:cell division protein FtsK [Legionellales bacterium]
QVSSKIDSRTILDQQGAEQLLGHGDMLYLAPGTGAPLRVHGAFVDDKEVHRIADDWRARGQPDYIDEITQTLDASEGGMGEDGEDTEDTDVLYDQVVEFVVQTRKASISAVQRRFKIGYNRAARLVEEMERTGIVGPLESGMRDVLVNNTAEEST